MKRITIPQIVLVVVGLILIAVGIIIWEVVDKTIHTTIENASIAVPENDKGGEINPWTRFLSNEDDPNNQREYSFYVYNLTNPAEFALGELPIYQERGPYTYKKIYSHLDYVLDDDEEIVTYKYWPRYTPVSPVPEGSRDPNADIIYHFNVAYYTIVKTATSENALAYSLGSSALAQTFAQVNTPQFIAVGESFAFPTIFSGMVGGFGLDTFCNEWLSLTNSSVPQLEPIRLERAIGTNANISVESCKLLFDPTVTMSMTNTSVPYVMQWTLNATGIIGDITQLFSINSTQYLSLLSWKQVMLPTVVAPLFLNKICGPGVCTEADIPYLQFSQAGGLFGGISIQLIAPQLPAKPELGIMVPGGNVNIAAARVLFSPTNANSLLQKIGFAKFVSIYLANKPALQVAYGINATEVETIFAYINLFTKAYVDDYIMKGVFASNGGLIVKHTAHDTLFNSVDPLLKTIYPTNPLMWKSNYVQQTFNETEARMTTPTDSCYTGKGDLNKILAPITLSGSKTYMYNPPTLITVTGFTSEQLPPYYLTEKVDQEVHVFSSEFQRTLFLKKDSVGSLGGLPYHRFKLDSSTWMVNPDFAITIPYVLPLEPVAKKPVYITRPRLKGVDVAYYAKAGLQSLAYDTEDNDLFGDYEPRTGKAIRGRYSIQINGYITPTDNAVFGRYTNITTDVLHPVFWSKNEVVANQKQINAINYAYKIDAVRYALAIILLVVGSFMVMGTVGLYVFDMAKEKIL